MKYTFLIIVCIVCFGCLQGDKHLKQHDGNPDSFGVVMDTILVSTLVSEVSDRPALYTIDPVHIDAKVKDAVYSHFEKNRTVSWEKYLQKSTSTDFSQIVDYDTLYSFNISGVPAWIARYSLMKELVLDVPRVKFNALVVQADTGLKIVHESILPGNFYIDSFKHRTLYGYVRSGRNEDASFRCNFYLK